MSVSEDSVSCPTENSLTVYLDSASGSDAKTVLKHPNVHSCHVEEGPQNDSELLKGLLTDTFCQICEAVLMFESQRVSHYEGKKHAQRVRIYLQTKKAERDKQSRESSSSFQSVTADPEKFCPLCNMVFSSPTVAQSHYQGKVHAKNTRKSGVASSSDARTAPSPAEVAEVAAASAWDDALQKPKDLAAPAAHRVDLSDPDKYCKLCAASFNNPAMSSEHYAGRKHQRNLGRQEQQKKLGEQSEHANSLTCPLCHVTLSSIDTYQAHMKANKHHVQEKTQEDSGKKKVYDSFQDELADYIQVQRSRGLEPKTGQISESQAHGKAERDVDERGKCRVQPETACLQSRLPAPALRTQPWRPPLHPHPRPAAFTQRPPVPRQWDRGYSSYPPPLIPGLTGKALRRARSPGSLSPSSSPSGSSSSYSSSSSSEDGRDRRKKRREGIKKRKERDDDDDDDDDYDSEEDLQRKRRERRRRESDSAKNPKRPQENSDEDHGKIRKEKKPRERAAKKRPREEDEEERDPVPRAGMAKGDREGEAQSEGLKEEKAKPKREKKKPKDRADNRTEEEKLWDATILGIF